MPNGFTHPPDGSARADTWPELKGMGKYDRIMVFISDDCIQKKSKSSRVCIR